MTKGQWWCMVMIAAVAFAAYIKADRALRVIQPAAIRPSRPTLI
jgi:hypothetical protein